METTTGTYFERSISKIVINCLTKLTNEFDRQFLSDVLLEKNQTHVWIQTKITIFQASKIEN